MKLSWGLTEGGCLVEHIFRKMVVSKTSEFVDISNVIIHLGYFDDKIAWTNKRKHVFSESFLKLRVTSETLKIDL